LYNFNANVELAEFSLPFELNNQVPEAGAATKNQGTKLSHEDKQRAA